MDENKDKVMRSVNWNQGQFRVTIPKQIALAMGIKDKDKVQFLIDRGDIILRKI